MKLLISTLFLCSSFYCSSQSFSGAWYANLDVMGQKLSLVLHLSDSNNVWRGTLDSPDQNAFGIEMSSVNINGRTLQFTIDRIGVNYLGNLNDSNQINGQFKQGGFKSELQFLKGKTDLPPRIYLQEPIEPYPYLAEEVSFLQKQENFHLRGTLTRLEESQPTRKPCIILISGSGPQDRNEEILGHKPFKLIADRLTLSGYIVLRYDDRGVGDSEGDFSIATSQSFATDAYSAVEFVKTLPYIDTNKIILMGHSEGAMVANIVAAEHKEIFAVVSLAGPGVSGAKILKEQQCLISKVNGAKRKDIEEIKSFDDAFYPLLKSDNIEKSRQDAEAYLKEYSTRLNSKELEEAGYTKVEDWIKINMDTYLSPWMLHFLNYDPKADLQKITCHYLAINGTKDLQVPCKMNLDAISAYCNPGEGRIKQITSLKGLNHLLQPTKTGNPAEYGSNEITVDEVVIKEIIAFIQKIAH